MKCDVKKWKYIIEWVVGEMSLLIKCSLRSLDYEKNNNEEKHNHLYIAHLEC